MWILDHLADIESDLSAIHRIQIDPDRNEWGGLSARRFFRLAWRLPCYEGAVRAAVLRVKREEIHPDDGGGPTPGGPQAIPLTPEMVRRGQVLGGLGGLESMIEYSNNG